MSTTVQEILIHGPEVIEKPFEARNKDIKKYRERFARKISRIEN